MSQPTKLTVAFNWTPTAAEDEALAALREGAERLAREAMESLNEQRDAIIAQAAGWGLDVAFAYDSRLYDGELLFDYKMLKPGEVPPIGRAWHVVHCGKRP